MIFRIYFLFFSNTNIKFAEQKLIYNLCNISEMLLTTKLIQFIDYKKFAATTLDLGKKVFLIYVTYLKVKMTIYLA